jgi:glycosyltransferase involved in cell wall biosynthesis
MKLLILSQYFWPENFRINDVVDGLTERGHSVTVYTGLPNYPGGRFYDGYGLLGPYRERYKAAEVRRAPLIARGRGGPVRLGLNFLSYAFFATVLAPWLVRGRYDAILVFEPSPMTVGIPARALRALKRAPLLFWVQDLWPESLSATGAVTNSTLLALVGRLVKWIYAGCDRVLVQSQAFAPSVRAFGVPADHIRYLPNTAESYYRKLEPRGDDPEAAELPAGFRVMYAGNVGVAQDFPTILAAAELLRDESAIHWIIFGDGRMLPWVKEQVARRGLKRFHLLGHRPPQRMAGYFAHADVLLATLRREPVFSLTIPARIQAYLACGKPVIAALEGEGARIIREARAGWVVPPEDPRELANAVLAASRASRSDLDRTGEAGRACFEEHFEREKLLSQLEAELQQVTQRR